MANQNDYFGLDPIISIILAIFVGPILGIIVRFMQGKIVPAVVRIVACVILIGAPIIWLLDLIWIIKDKKICDLGGII
ncbi:MAG: hypothetical protein ACI4M6_02180 [Christensenellaceae bacterium]